MPEPIQAGLWGLAAASSLVAGAAAGVWLKVPRRAVALVMGFGAGALISALAFDLTAEAFAGGGTIATAAGLAAGAMTYFIGDMLLQRSARRHATEPPRQGPIAATSGPSIVLGTLLDGLPESIVLGASILGGAGISTSLLAAIFLSNVPEGVAGGRDLSDEGHGRGWIIGLWVGVALASGLAAAIGNALLSGMDAGAVALVQAYAGGAILTMLADTMIPEAFEDGGDWVGLATVLGFASAFLLSRA
ncbi:MAG TPA: ZIP family zinc transporter [Candidatus Limnocylindria bacterium]|nr:ZIP family zinc transporter [Candidatus Limnocylindria bacterium]